MNKKGKPKNDKAIHRRLKTLEFIESDRKSHTHLQAIQPEKRKLNHLIEKDCLLKIKESLTKNQTGKNYYSVRPSLKEKLKAKTNRKFEDSIKKMSALNTIEHMSEAQPKIYPNQKVSERFKAQQQGQKNYEEKIKQIIKLGVHRKSKDCMAKSLQFSQSSLRKIRGPQKAAIEDQKEAYLEKIVRRCKKNGQRRENRHSTKQSQRYQDIDAQDFLYGFEQPKSIGLENEHLRKQEFKRNLSRVSDSSIVQRFEKLKQSFKFKHNSEESEFLELKQSQEHSKKQKSQCWQQKMRNHQDSSNTHVYLSKSQQNRQKSQQKNSKVAKHIGFYYPFQSIKTQATPEKSQMIPLYRKQEQNFESGKKRRSNYRFKSL